MPMQNVPHNQWTVGRRGRMRGYNYPVFSFDMDPVGVEEWLKDGPGPGEPGPDFALETLPGAGRSILNLGRAPWFSKC